MVLAPDTAQQAIYTESIAPHLRPGDVLMFAHGFNIRFGLIDPPEGVDVAMVAPRARAPRAAHLRRRRRGAVPAGRGARRQRQGQGARARLTPGRSARPGPACSRRPSRRRPRPTFSASRSSSAAGLTSLIKAGFDTLVEAGYQPESAYFECLHEVKLIVDLIYEHGITGMRYSISTTAEYGDMTRGPRVVGDAARAGDEEDPGGHPVRGICRGMGRGEPQGLAQLPPPAGRGRRAPGREGRGRSCGR